MRNQSRTVMPSGGTFGTLKCPILLSALVVSFIYWVTALFTPARDMIIVNDSISIVMSFTVFLVYSRRLLRSLWSHRPDVTDFLITGIAFGWLINSLDRMWRMVARVTGNAWMLNTYVIGYMLLMLAFCAGLHLAVHKAMVRDKVEGAIVSYEAAWLIGVTLVVGILLAGLVVAVDHEWIRIPLFISGVMHSSLVGR